MAIGDLAAEEGYEIVPGSGEAGKVKHGAREINRTRDYAAALKKEIREQTHDAADITVAGVSITNATDFSGALGFRTILGIRYGSAAPSNSDGRPDGSIYLRYV